MEMRKCFSNSIGRLWDIKIPK